MMIFQFPSFTMLVLGTILYYICSQANGAGLPSTSTFINLHTPDVAKTVEMSTNFEHKFESLMQIVNKMDESIKNLQEKAHTWAIFQHHINSWNDGIRILENKLDLLKRTHEEQQQQLNKIEYVLGHESPKVNTIIDEIKQSLKAERDFQEESSEKANTILRHIQKMQSEKSSSSAQPHKKNANFMAPIYNNNNNGSNKVEHRLNTIIHQMAQQKDLKQLHSLEKRSAKGLEGITRSLANVLDKQEEITTRQQRSNECCHSLSNELTTFTESSDILLKRIEKLMRNVSERINQIEQREDSHEDGELDDRSIAASTEDTEIFSDDVSNHNDEEDIDISVGVEAEIPSITEEYGGYDNNIDEHPSVEVDENIQDIEFLRPNLKGCHDLLLNSTSEDHIDGIYKFQSPEINDKERDFNERFCVFPTSDDIGGLPWTIIQRRGPYSQQENFNRSWSEYRSGFGYLYRDFWFGNEFIHRLVYPEDYELRIEMEDFNGTQVWAEYETFRIDSETFNYNLLIDGHRGTAADALKYHNDNDFSTFDRRNDRTVDACCSCAVGYASGWWFDNCSEANLNGLYHDTPLNHNYIGIMWELWHGDYSLKATRMMIRPRNNHTNPNTTVNTQDHNDHGEEYSEDP